MAGATSAAAHPSQGRLVQDALFYSSAAELAEAITEFVLAGNEGGQAALVAVPGERGDAVRASLKTAHASTKLVDMRELGHNPGRIIPAVRRFVAAHPGGVRFVGEPIWSGRTRTGPAGGCASGDWKRASSARSPMPAT